MNISNINNGYNLYRLYECQFYFTLKKINLLFKCSTKKIYKYELEKYDIMEKFLLHCANLCDTIDGPKQYDNITMILNTYMMELYSQDYRICKCQYHIKNYCTIIYAIDSPCKIIIHRFINECNFINTTTISHDYLKNILMLSEIPKSYDVRQKYIAIKIKNKIIQLLQNINYRYLFDIIDFIQMEHSDNHINFFCLMTTSYIDAFIIKCFIDNIFNIFFTKNNYIDIYSFRSGWLDIPRNINVLHDHEQYGVIFTQKNKYKFQDYIEIELSKIVLKTFQNIKMYGEIYEKTLKCMYYNTTGDINDDITFISTYQYQYHKFNIDKLFIDNMLI